MGIFLEFLWFSEYFSCFKIVYRFSGIILRTEKYLEKKLSPSLTGRARRPDPSPPGPAADPLPPVKAHPGPGPQLSRVHGRHGLRRPPPLSACVPCTPSQGTRAPIKRAQARIALALVHLAAARAQSHATAGPAPDRAAGGGWPPDSGQLCRSPPEVSPPPSPP
jgi:hypothetical protein